MKKHSSQQLSLFSPPPMVAGESPAREDDMPPLETGGGESWLNPWCYVCGGLPKGKGAEMYEVQYQDHVKITYLCDDCVLRVGARQGVRDVRRWEP